MKTLVLSFTAFLFSIVLSAAAMQAFPSGEGFSDGREGLPAFAANAWNATVLIDKETRGCKNKPNFSLNSMSYGWGSGVIINFDPSTRMAIIATNYHVVRPCEGGVVRNQVGFLKGNSSESSSHAFSTLKVVSTLPLQDIALVQSKVPSGVSVAVAHLGSATLGEKVVAIGYPDLKQRSKWTQRPLHSSDRRQRYSIGLVRNINPSYPYTLDAGTYVKVPVIFHMADILPGNSGGPLINSRGEVIGLNTKVFWPTVEQSKSRAYCANGSTGECAHLAVNSELIAKEFKRQFGTP